MKIRMAASVALGALLVPCVTLTNPVQAAQQDNVELVATQVMREDAAGVHEMNNKLSQMLYDETPMGLDPNVSTGGIIMTDTEVNGEIIETPVYSQTTVIKEQEVGTCAPQQSNVPITETEVSRVTTTTTIPVTSVVTPSGVTVIPYGEDGLPLNWDKVGVTEREVGMVCPVNQQQGVSFEIPVSTLHTDGRASSEKIEWMTPLTVDRLESKDDGGVLVTYSTEFRQDEYLTFNHNNEPELMTKDASGKLVSHPERVAAYHPNGNEILIIDRDISLRDLQDNPFPTSTFAEPPTLGLTQAEREVAMTTTDSNPPIMASDFERPLPVEMSIASADTIGFDERVVGYNVCGYPLTTERVVTRDTAGNIVERETSYHTEGDLILLPSDRHMVGYTSELPAGWRGLTIGNSVMILDNNGVVRDVVPNNAMY